MKIFHLPDLGEGLAEAEIREWYVKEGDTVTVDQPLVSMETAKAIVDVPSPYEGKITKLHGKVNDIVQTGAALISYELDGAEAAAENKPVADKQDKGSVVGKLEQSTSKWDDGNVVIGSARSKIDSIKVMPAARVLANEMGVNLQTIKATGPKGLITVADVKSAMTGTKPVAQTEVHLPEGAEALHGVRRLMAQAMAQSQQEIVPVTIIEDADLTDLPSGTDITVLLLNAIVAAAKAEPALNAWFDGKSLKRKIFEEVNIGLAVDTAEGLFVPVIKHAEKQSDAALREQVNAFKDSVSARTIKPSDMQGLTITLSNFGTIAGRYATPIIVPPSVAILGCGRSRETAVVKNGNVVAGKVMPLSLTFDHRAATGGEATRFLAAVIKHLQG